jgi:DNA invertase Pin-like site-specific DNA recombinase
MTRPLGAPDVPPGMVFGLDGKWHPSRRLDTTNRDRKIRQLRAGGQSVRTIAAAAGCSVGTVHRVIRLSTR